jgi:hypothetical protein
MLTRRIALAAALGLALAPVAHAAEPAPVLDWIVVTMDTSSPADKAATALIEPWRYNLVGCAEEKGKVEGFLHAKYPQTPYVVFCAQVPGLRQ